MTIGQLQIKLACLAILLRLVCRCVEFSGQSDGRGSSLGALCCRQIVFLPLLMAVILVSGWRSVLMMITVTATSLIPAICFWMRDKPADVGLERYRSAKGRDAQKQTRLARGEIRPMSMSAMSEVIKTSTFWILAGCFLVCGATAAISGGWVRVHFGDYQYASAAAWVWSRLVLP